VPFATPRVAIIEFLAMGASPPRENGSKRAESAFSSRTSMLPHGFSHDSRALHVRAGMPLRTSARSARARINRLPFYHKGIRRCKPAPLDGSDLLQGSHGAFILARAHDSSWLNARRLCTASPTGSRVSRYRTVSFVREETRGGSTRPSSSPLLFSLFPVAFSVSVRLRRRI